MIRKAKKEEIPQLLAITRDCAQHMISQNIYQWNDIYPSEKAFENDVLREELFVLMIENILIGCIVLTPKTDKEYLLNLRPETYTGLSSKLVGLV